MSTSRPTVATPAEAFDLTHAHVLVTGGHKGLGRAMAEAAAAAGARITVTARDEAQADLAQEQLLAQGFSAQALKLDVTNCHQIEHVFKRAAVTFGPVTGLINNTGVSIGAPADKTTQATWRTVMDTNLDGVWECSLAFARQLETVDAPGAIVNIGSISAHIVNRPRWQAPYLASKAAVHQLTRALAAEWAERGIRVNAIAPGYFLTDMSPVDQPEYHEYCVEPAALKRYGLPHELGPAAVFLLSKASSFMTGAVLTIDGGFTLF